MRIKVTVGNIGKAAKAVDEYRKTLKAKTAKFLAKLAQVGVQIDYLAGYTTLTSMAIGAGGTRQIPLIRIRTNIRETTVPGGHGQKVCRRDHSCTKLQWS